MSFRSFLQFRNTDARLAVRDINSTEQVRMASAIMQVRDMVAAEITMSSALSSVNIAPSALINGPQVNIMGIN